MQDLVLRKYASGRFDHLRGVSTLREIEDELAGDTLALLLFREAGDSKGSSQEFEGMLNKAVQQLEDLGAEVLLEHAVASVRPREGR